MSDAPQRSWYERTILPYLLDFACGMKPIRRQRRKVVPLARGNVLEIGIGTGLNLEHYEKSAITKLVGLDPGLEMHRLARKRANAAGIDVELVGLSAERIPFSDRSFDSVVVTYSLCTIPDPLAALKEMRRVLTSDGRLIFCEHGRAPDAKVAIRQARMNGWWGKIAGGCQLDRDVPQLLQAAGLRALEVESMYLPGPRPLTYNYWGTAARE